MITKSFSLYLDLWRVVAASLVLLYHSTTLQNFSNGLIARQLGLENGRAAHLAVVIFFVLSGFLISYSASKPNLSWQKYFTDRLARMYSVVLPALALTAVVMMVIAGFDPVLYEKLTINGHQLLRYGISALFLQQIWTFCVVPGMLGPIWSLGYEFWYYVLLGVWTFVPGKGLKWSLLAVISVLIGPKVMLLLGAWLAGVFAHRLCSGRRPAAFHKFIFWITLLVTAAGLAFSANLPLWNEELGQAPLYYSANWRVDLLFSPVFALNLWSGFLTLRSNAEPARGFRPIERFIRYSAGISFSVYLYHAPLFYLFAIFISPPGDVFGELVLLFAVLAVVMILARYTEQKLGIYRSAVARIMTLSLLVFKKLPAIKKPKYEHD